MADLTDIALMMQVRAGELDCLGTLYERYHLRLFGFFFRLTHRREVSEDLVHAVFERLLRYRTAYAGDGEFSAWIFRIARNVFADHYRKYMIDDQGTPVLQLSESEMDDVETLTTHNDARLERQRLLLKALNQLDEQKRQAIVLSRYQGFDYEEIAQIMNCTENVVKTRVFRGIQELKRLMTDNVKGNQL